MAWFTFLRVSQPGPGAGAYALATKRMRDETMIGTGVVAGSLNPLQPPQVMHGIMLPVGGLGGLSSGQIVGQPLTTPEDVISTSYSLG